MISEENKHRERSVNLHSIRPDLELLTIESQTFEYFQNQVIRPILKFQNELFLLSFRESKQFQQHMNKVDKTNRLFIEQAIADFINTNNSFKNRMYGYILGLMTTKEFGEYLEGESEYNKRIRTMLVKRVHGQLYQE